MEMWYDHTGVDERGIHRKRAMPAKGDGALSIDLTPMLDVVMIMLIWGERPGQYVGGLDQFFAKLFTTKQSINA